MIISYSVVHIEFIHICLYLYDDHLCVKLELDFGEINIDDDDDDNNESLDEDN